MTDASGTGWSGVLLPRRVEGKWSPREALHPITWKELKAVQLSLLHFVSDLEEKVVRVYSDSSTVVSCIRKQGSLASPDLLVLSRQILVWCRQKNIVLVPTHLKGVLNVLADQGSRSGPIQSEWSLDPVTFWKICRHWGTPQVDLFATRENNQLDVYVSPCPNKTALSMDALSQDWNAWESIYLFPPWALLPQVVPRLETFKGTGFLIAPLWPTRPWFLPLVKRCKSVLSLPESHRLSQFMMEGKVICNRTKFFCLHAWEL